MDVEIRLGQLEDADTIAEFQIAMARETEDKRLEPEVVAPAVRKVFSDPAKGFYLVAVENRDNENSDSSKVIGSLLITYEWSDWRDSFVWYIQSVYVEERARGRGVFRRLFDRVLEMAKKDGVLFVRLYVETENLRAQKIYESLGMKRLPYFMYDLKIEA